MAISLTLDTTQIQKGLKKATDLVDRAMSGAVTDVAYEVLRLSALEVPLDTGMLLTSGSVQPSHDDKEKLVGYNKVYAARLHEHPEYHFGNGRKGKYLEDPIKMNLRVFQTYFSKAIAEALR